VRVEDAADLEETMRTACETDGPVLVDVRVTQEENVYPMIAPGNPAREMVEAPGLVR
jgi:acetolactate synthase-1/2/3 large subunit